MSAKQNGRRVERQDADEGLAWESTGLSCARKSTVRMVLHLWSDRLCVVSATWQWMVQAVWVSLRSSISTAQSEEAWLEFRHPLGKCWRPGKLLREPKKCNFDGRSRWEQRSCRKCSFAFHCFLRSGCSPSRLDCFLNTSALSTVSYFQPCFSFPPSLLESLDLLCGGF